MVLYHVSLKGEEVNFSRTDTYTHFSTFEVSHGEYFVEGIGFLLADDVLRGPGHPSKHFSNLRWRSMERNGIVLMTDYIIVWKALRYL